MLLCACCNAHPCDYTQKYEEQSNHNGPVSIADIENETVVKLVDAGVTAMMTRLQSMFTVTVQTYIY